MIWVPPSRYIYWRFRFLVALPPVRDLLFCAKRLLADGFLVALAPGADLLRCAKHLFVEANIAPTGDRRD